MASGRRSRRVQSSSTRGQAFKSFTDGTGACEKQRDGFVLDERREVELALGLDSERLATRREQPQRRCVTNELGHCLGRVGQEMLRVVQHHVRTPPAQRECDGVGVLIGCAEPLRDGRNEELGIAKRRERHEDGASVRLLGEEAGELDRNRVLPVPPGPSTVSTGGSCSRRTETPRTARARP